MADVRNRSRWASGRATARWLGLALAASAGWACESAVVDLAETDALRWVRAVGGADPDLPARLAWGPFDRGVFTVETTSELEIDGTPIAARPLPTTALIGFDAEGRFAVQRTFDTQPPPDPVEVWNLELAVDRTQSTILAGSVLGGDLRLDDRVLTAQNPGANGFEAFVVRLSPRGDVDWGLRMGGDSVRVRAVAVDDEDAIVVAGEASGRFEVDGRPVEAGTSDGFVIKLSASGRLRWWRLLRSEGRVQVADVAVGPDRSVVVAGVADGPLGSGDRERSFEGEDVYWSRWAGDGTQLELAVAGQSAAAAVVTSVAVRARTVIAGTFGGTWTGPAGPVTAQGGSDAFVLDPDADQSQLITGAGPVAVQDVALDRAERVWLTGAYRDRLRFGSEDRQSVALAGFLARLGSDLVPEAWLEIGPGTGDRAGGRLAATRTGDIVVLGVFEGELNLGEGLVSRGGPDVLLARFRGSGP
jgi:hypothetical protein